MATKFLTNIDLQKNQITNVAIHNIDVGNVSSPVLGQIIWDTVDKKLKYWDGTGWQVGGLNGLNITPTTGTLTIANGTTLASYNTIGLYATNGSTVNFNSGGNVAFKDLTLSQFAATSSTQLAGIITDETGAGKLVFSNDATLINPIIDNILASGATVNTDLWSEVTTGSITVGAGLTTGAVNIATAGTGATSINIGHAQSTVTFLGNVALPSNTTKVGQTPLIQGGTGSITLPSATGTLALITNIGTGSLAFSIGAAGASGTSITWGTNSGFNANSTSNSNYQLSVGPSLSGLATFMATNATAGFIKKIGVDNYALDINTYLTAETDTLETVTTRGNSSSKIISISNTQPNIMGNESTGALIVAGGVGIGGNVSIGGNLNVDGTITYINSNEVNIGDNIILLNADISNTSQNSDGGIEVKRLDSTNSAKNASLIFNDTTDRWQTTFGDVSGTLVTAQLANKGVTFVGDGTNTAYSITHNFGTQDLTVAIREVASPYALVYADVEFTSINNITVKFATAPLASQYKVTIIG